MVPDEINPLKAVRQTTAAVMRQARHVTINEVAIARYAAELVQNPTSHAKWDNVNHLDEQTPTAVHYVLALDALNFCFWPAPEWDYDRLARRLKEATLADREWLSAARLATITPEKLQRILGDSIPLLEERARLLREVGTGLLDHWGGEATALVQAAERSAARLVSLITAEFPGFRDHAIYQGQQVFLYKRAQIFAGDLWGLFRGEQWGAFDDIADLTMFADYRVPQLLRELDILRYSGRLAPLIDVGRQLDPGSEWEVELRAASIQAVEQLRDRMGALGHSVTSLQLDWYLWQQGEARQERLRPHHRTLTIFY